MKGNKMLLLRSLRTAMRRALPCIPAVWGASSKRGKYRGVGKLSTWSVGFASMKHAKEVRSFNPAYDQAKSYVFGKVNALYILRLGWGKRTVATPKLRNGGVSVGWHYSFGAALGLTKPVYLEIGYPQIPYTYLLTQRYDPAEHGTERHLRPRRGHERHFGVDAPPRGILQGSRRL